MADQFESDERIVFIFESDNISAKRKMTYLNACCYEDIKKIAEEQGFSIIPDFQMLAFRILTTPNLRSYPRISIDDIQLRFIYQTIIIYQAETPEDASAKFTLVLQPQNKAELLRFLQCQEMRVILNQYLMIPEQQNCIIFVLENNLQLQRRVLETRLNEFMSTRIQVNFQIKQEIIELDEDLVFDPKFMKYIYEKRKEFPLIQIEFKNPPPALHLSGKTCPEYQYELENQFKKLKQKIEQLNNGDINNSYIFSRTQNHNTPYIVNPNILVFVIYGSASLKQTYFNKKYKNEKNINFQAFDHEVRFSFTGEKQKIQSLKQMVKKDVANLKMFCRKVHYDQSNDVKSFLLDERNRNYFNNLLDLEFSQEVISSKIRSVDRDNQGVIIRIDLLFTQQDMFQRDRFNELNQLLNSLECIEFDVEIDRFRGYYQIADFNKFLQDQNLILQKLNNKSIVLGKQTKIKHLSSMLQQYKENPRQSQLLRKRTTITIENRLIYLQIKQQASQNLLELPNECSITFPQNTTSIVLSCFNIQVIQNSIQIIEQFSQQARNNIHKIELNQYNAKIFSQEECKQKIKNLEENHLCSISFGQVQKTDSGMEEIIISYNEKRLILKCGVQSDQECDLIVLQTKSFICLRNQQDLGQAKQNLIQKFGNQYVNHCIKNVSNQDINDISVYPNQRYQKNILNIMIPTFQFGADQNVYKQSIQRNMKKIFEKAQELNSTSISITIQGSGACSNVFKFVSKEYLINIINELFSVDTIVQNVYIYEQYEPRFQELKSITQMLIYPQRQRQVKFDWYKNDEKYDELINSYIDEDYEIYESDNNQYKFQIEYSFLQHRATHCIDIINKTIMDLQTDSYQSLEFSEIQGRKVYYIGPNQLDDRLINYFNLQELENENLFEVCLTQYFIVFKKEGYYEETFDQPQKFVFTCDRQTIQHNETNHILLELDFTWEEKYYIQSTQINENTIEVQTCDIFTEQIVLNQLEQIINENIVTFVYQVPNLFDEEINNLKKIVMASAISIKNKIEGGQQVEIKVLKNDRQLIEQNLSLFNETIRAYPTQWAIQRNIVEKVLLNPMSEEYQNIVNKFKETDQGQIHQIKRIQNKILWENYSNETNKLIKYHQRIGYNMNLEERQRYVWHGVRGQHPKIIYEGMKEGFNCAFSANGMWGPGIYFAQNASYSRGYSYTLQQEEGPQHQGRLIMLYCLLTTGKVENRNSDGNIRQPSIGFDCVSGETNGSQVFILYAMDIRRAYPAYEIIFS